MTVPLNIHKASNSTYPLHLLVTLLMLVYGSVAAQYKVTLTILLPKETTAYQNLYLAGNINQWQPNDVAYKSKQINTKAYSIYLPNCPKKLEYKITNGSWDAVETNADGTDVDNRILHIVSDTNITIKVAAFKADGAPQTYTKASTKSTQVQLLSDSFYFPTLNVYRKVWIYVPKNWTKKTKYPVLYMHDAQNTFDRITAFKDEWGVDEYLDQAAKQCIVVAIDNGGAQRLIEYSFASNAMALVPKGKQYIHDIVHTLIPYVTKQYNTATGSKHTYIAGSSMGGIISYYAGIQYPKIFGKVGVFSPAFWINYKPAQELAMRTTGGIRQHYYFYAGQQESPEMVQQMAHIYNLLKAKRGKSPFKLSIKGAGKHDELSWSKELPGFFDWLLR